MSIFSFTVCFYTFYTFTSLCIVIIVALSEGLNLQNIQTAHRTQQQQQTQSKIRQKTETDIPPKETQMAHEKMFNIAND